MRTTLQEHKESLRMSLKKALEFDQEKNIGLSENFRLAIRLLDADQSEVEECLEKFSLPLSDYPDPVEKQVLAACKTAWVFGAAGSWYDVSFTKASDISRYNEVTEEFYSAICAALQDIAPYTEQISV